VIDIESTVIESMRAHAPTPPRPPAACTNGWWTRRSGRPAAAGARPRTGRDLSAASARQSRWRRRRAWRSAPTGPTSVPGRPARPAGTNGSDGPRPSGRRGPSYVVRV